MDFGELDGHFHLGRPGFTRQKKTQKNKTPHKTPEMLIFEVDKPSKGALPPKAHTAHAKHIALNSGA